MSVIRSKTVGRASLKIPFKAGMWYTASSVITKAVSVLSTPIFTRLMRADQYALYPLYLSYIGIISALSGSEAIASAAFVTMHKNEIKRDNISASATLLIIAANVLICLLYFVFYGLFGDLTGFGRRLSLMLFFQVSFDGIINISALRWRSEYRYIPVFLSGVLPTVASTAIGLYLVSETSIKSEGRIIALLIVSALTVGILSVNTTRSGGYADPALLRYITKRALPLLPQGILGALLIGQDRIMINAYAGSEAVAGYSVAHSIGVGICFLSTAMITALRPWIYRRLEAYETSRIREAVDKCASLLCLAALALICVSPEIIAILAPKEYSDAIFVILPTALSVAPSFLTAVISSAVIYKGSDGRVIIPSLISAAVSIVLNVIFLKLFSYKLVSISNLAANVIGLILWLILYKRRMRGELFSGKSFLLKLLLSFISALVIFIARDYLTLRLIFLAIIIIAPLPLYKSALEIVKEPRR